MINRPNRLSRITTKDKISNIPKFSHATCTVKSSTDTLDVDPIILDLPSTPESSDSFPTQIADDQDTAHITEVLKLVGSPTSNLLDQNIPSLSHTSSSTPSPQHASSFEVDFGNLSLINDNENNNDNIGNESFSTIIPHSPKLKSNIFCSNDDDDLEVTLLKDELAKERRRCKQLQNVLDEYDETVQRLVSELELFRNSSSPDLQSIHDDYAEKINVIYKRHERQLTSIRADHAVQLDTLEGERDQLVRFCEELIAKLEKQSLMHHDENKR